MKPSLFEPLEERKLMSGYSLQQVLTQYDAGAAAVINAGLADTSLGQKIPLVTQTISKELGLGTDLQLPFQTQPVASAAWSTVQSLLQSKGFSINVPFTGTPDSNGNLLEVSWSHSWSAPVNFISSGKTGFDYLDKASGFLGGSLSGSNANVAAGITFGVKVQNGQPTFFVADGPALKVGGFSASGSITGNITIGSLADIDASLTAKISLTQASVNFKSVYLTPGSNKLSGTVSGSISGSVSLNGSLTASLPLLPDITWSPSFGGTISNAGFTAGSFDLNAPSAQSLLSGLGQQLFSLGGNLLSPGSGIPLLGPLTNALNAKIPLINQSIADLTGFGDDLPTFPTSPGNLGSDSLSGMLGVLSQYGVSVNDGHTAVGDLTNMATQLVQGKYTGDLLSWTSGEKSFSLANLSYSVPILGIGVPDIASAEIDATFSLNASLNYDVGFGINSKGFWFQTGNASQHTLGLTFSATAGLEGQVEVFGFPLADAYGNIGFSVTPYVDLTAPDGGSKVYISQLQEFGSNPFTDVLDAMNAGVKGDLTGTVGAGIDLFFFSVDWSWGIDIPVFDFSKQAAWPSNLPSGTTQSPFQLSNGVLSFNGASTNDNVLLTQTAPGTVTASDNGGATVTFSGVNKFAFHGNGGSDRLTPAPGFNIPVYADVSGEAPTSRSYLQAGDAGSTLIGGSGSDTLVGGDGNDSVTAGSGNATLIGGDGHDTLSAGSGSGADQIYSGAGNSTLIGNAGADSIFGGGGNDTIHGGSGAFFIDAGAGNNAIYGYANDSAHSFTRTGVPVIHAGSGKNTIYGGAAASQIFGDGGSDTIYGASGSDTIHGGAGGDNFIQGSTSVSTGGNLIYGGGDGDTLVGGNGNNRIYAGNGNETIYGGDGKSLSLPANFSAWQNVGGDGKSAGRNLIVAGSGNDLIYGDTTGRNTLIGGAGHDSLIAGTGGDYLVSGSGSSTLYGGNGDDSLQLQFSPGSTGSPAVVTGGPGVNTLVINPINPGPGKLTSSIDSSTTTVTVSNGNDITPAQIAAKGGYYIQVEGEQMKVLSVSGNALKVARGQNHTIAGVHQNGTTVLADPHQLTPGGYSVYLKNTSTANQYQATLSNLTATGAAGSQIGQVTFSMFNSSQGIGQLELEAGPGNNAVTVDPAVKLNVYLYGGNGNDTLTGGGGSDTLVAGTGNSILNGGGGDDILYAGDLPADDNLSNLQDQVNGTTGGTVKTRSSPASGIDTLIGGIGNDELFAANAGNNVLIGGPAALTNGKYVLGSELAADRDLLDARQATGNNLMIVNPGGQGMLYAGAGKDTLVADNAGSNLLQGGTGAALMLGGNLQNFEIGGTGPDTLVGGAGLDVIQAGTGNQSLYADANASLWATATATAASRGVTLAATPNPLSGNPATLLDSLTKQLDQINAEVKALPNPKYPTPAQTSARTSLGNEVSQIGALLQADGHLLGGNLSVDSLLGGIGNDSLYGGSHLTYMSSSGKSGTTDAFYNYMPGDTLAGGSNSTNELLLQGDGAITVDNINGGAQVQVGIGGKSYTVAKTFTDTTNNIHITNMQVLGLQTLAGNDSITVATGTTLQQAGFNAFNVITGSGTDTVNAIPVQIREIFQGGSGNTTFNVGTSIPAGGSYTGGSGYSTLNVQGTKLNNYTVANGVLTLGGNVTEAVTKISKLVLKGAANGAASTFTTDGTIPNEELDGGTGSNVFTVRAPSTVTIKGSAGASNQLIINCDDNDDDVYLSQSGSNVTATGSLTVHASNLTGITVYGSQSGGSRLDASAMQLGVNLVGSGSDNALFGGAGADTLDGGSGDYNDLYAGNNSDLLYFSAGRGCYYDGTGGNTIVYRGQSSDSVVFYPSGFLLNGQLLSGTYSDGEPYTYLPDANYYGYGLSGIGAIVVAGGASARLSQQADVPGYGYYTYDSSDTQLASQSFTISQDNDDFNVNLTLPIGSIGTNETANASYTTDNASVSGWTWGAWTYNTWPGSATSISANITGHAGDSTLWWDNTGTVTVTITVTGEAGTYNWGYYSGYLWSSAPSLGTFGSLAAPAGIATPALATPAPATLATGQQAQSVVAANNHATSALSPANLFSTRPIQDDVVAPGSSNAADATSLLDAIDKRHRKAD